MWMNRSSPRITACETRCARAEAPGGCSDTESEAFASSFVCTTQPLRFHAHDAKCASRMPPRHEPAYVCVKALVSSSERLPTRSLGRFDETVADRVRKNRHTGPCMEWLNYHHLLYFWMVAK